ncbi:hypothetical protein CGCSCA4_v005297 [Colletotrichum siamense]|uniref:MARVEL domain-containing protein n=1 Tax=Colletotrichum siamense TaxID=690259 RepID=A0A9P5K7Q5_COLSI|nr:uncharacterized protein CGCS363_v010556 [Colletotrichum siamense]KAI8237107.1 hypothetical protein K4K54_001053 [Colletotrichum sp. SAR 10_86]KAJ4998509.1 hypothetical protein K4K48_005348 [Colletotrichum sp. SAR 10_66]KAF4848019.1 hypothetical protein CGCSCA4_v005297 [Colletotrichum siamense]KAF4861256.1 hypothetical protein CGCSCA2_v004759 [Colletotrichum siamense]KAF5491826.1 hypothetical protein CGCS363_v010556 [Colletotrichum siamense]
MNALFSSKLKFPIHMVQLLLVAAALGLSVARIFMPNRPRGRSGTMALGMSAKSLAIILYQVLTEHVPALHRWASLKANLILNAMEIVFWAAVVYMGIQSQTQQSCIGTSCTIGWVVVVLGILLSMVAGYATIIAWLDFRYFKKNGVRRGAMGHDAAPLESRCEDQSVESVQIQEVRREQRKNGDEQRYATAAYGQQTQGYTHQQQQQQYAQQQAYQPAYPQQTYGQQYTQHGYGRQ